MKRFSLGRLGFIAVAMSAIGMCAPAFAGDFPAPTYSRAPMYVAPIYDWSGPYIGANGGWGSSRACWDFTTPGGNFVASEGCHNANGGTAGGQLGYRWQSNAIVFGIEGQGNWAGLKGSNNSNFFLGSTNQTSVNALGLLTGQIGYAWDRTLIYAKGGAAVTDNKYTANSTLPPLMGFDTARESRWGATLGAGVEYAFAQNWSLGFEYDHLFMGNRDVNSATGFLIADHIEEDVDLFSARLNYKFGGPAVGRY